MTNPILNDLKAALDQNIITEPQAASIAALSNRRRLSKEALVADEEPIELFRGFSEIFLTLGLGLLCFGVLGSAVLTSQIFAGIIGIALTILAARYYTLKRRMILPSIVIAIAFAFSCAFLIVGVFEQLLPNTEPGIGFLIVSIFLLASLIGYYRAFKLPFTILLIGIALLSLVYSMQLMLFDLSAFESEPRTFEKSYYVFYPISFIKTTAVQLITGFIMLCVGLYFDLQDPHRISRCAACGFWAHLMAAFTLVNAAAGYALGLDGGYALGALAILLTVITVVALILDRRSFLTAGLAYFISLVFLVSSNLLDTSSGTWLYNILFIGLVFTILGTFWTQLRRRLMTALPDYAWKSKLPPYGDH